MWLNINLLLSRNGLRLIIQLNVAEKHSVKQDADPESNQETFSSVQSLSHVQLFVTP